MFSDDGLSMTDLDTFEDEAKQSPTGCSTNSESDIFSLAGSEMRNFLPQIFHLFALQAHSATEEQDGLQIPEPWIVLIEALPLISENYYHHLFQLQERCLEMILSSIARVLLAVFTKWPTQITQTIDQTRTYRMQDAWNPDGEIIKKHSLEKDSHKWKPTFVDQH